MNASMIQRWRRVFVVGLIASLLAGAVLTACSDERMPMDSGLIARPKENHWPARFQQAAPEVQEAYRFAVAHPDVLQYMPCYCGCVDQGHTSNKDCFIDEIRADGSVVLDPMSFG